MVSQGALAGFALVALSMVLTPGPNMIYLLTRSITQGRWAGFVSLLGVLAAFLLYMLGAALGLTAVLLAVPLTYDAIRWVGAAYLLHLAWNAVRPGARSVLEPRPDLPTDGTGRLFAMGFLTNLLNPKAAVLYLSLLPQFVDPEAGQVLAQSVLLGLTQIAVSFTVNLAIVLAAGSVATWFATRPSWLRAQRWIMGSVLAALALRVAVDPRAA
ncbi:LysE family translocator [Arenibaculum pallidiluteum]|uniref:LysE family translocator n=1 Tax=Arenibaculum pallidiluteum TaxID=2812559 RepID=UPI001A95805A|nr:LysE family translocator [Arenibaculum pallidiluteum]